jgi:pimeloyl-ACP methyl ester carboxylesterase
VIEWYLDASGRRSRVLEDGAGHGLVWLHDTLGNRWSAGQARLAEHGFRVIAPSLPGVDDSTTLDGIDGPEDVVFWLLDVLHGLELEHATLLGCGLGGWMAAEFAIRYPHRIERLVLADAYGLRVDGALAADEFALTRPMLRPLLFADPSSDVALDLLPDVDPPDRAEAMLHARAAAARLAWQFPYDRKLLGRLHRADVPALVVWGERDRLISPQHGSAYVSGLPNARLAIVPDAGHFPYVERPSEFADAVGEFLEGT